MNPFKTIGPALRRLGVILLIAILVSLFLFLYYFRYIPDNRERIERQGFLSLKQHSNGIQQTVQDLNNFFCQRHTNFLKDPWYNEFRRNNYKDPFQYSVSRFELKTTARTPELDSCISEIRIDPIGENIIYSFRRATDSLVYATPVETLFGKTLVQGGPDFFQSYFIIENDETARPRIIYHEQRISIMHQIQNDSMVKKFFISQFPRITDLAIGGNEYKAFVQPVNLQGKSLLLIGLKSVNEYQKELQGIPFNTLSSIIIAFILVLFILPYIKIFMVGQEEHLGIRDVVFVGISMLIGTAVIVVILHQLLMQTGAFLRTKRQLYSLSKDINANLHSEINNAYNELKYFDTSLERRKSMPEDSIVPNKDGLLIKKNSPGNDSFYFIKFPQQHSYSNYTIAHWADNNGQQVYKARLDNNGIQFVPIKSRDYFNFVKKGNLNSFPAGEADSFWIEPVYSTSTQVFEANLSMPSRVTTMAALSIQLSSVMNTVVPPGYGFYIINNDGLIYFQSQKEVTLQENFLEWVNDDKNLAQTLDTRQTRYMASQYINNKQYSLLLRPLDNLPLHLVVYYCNEQATASILRVDAFTIFCLALLYLVLFLFCVVFWNYTNYPTRLEQPIYQYNWIRPEKAKAKFLSAANYFLLAYILFTSIYAFFNREHSTSVFIAIISPFFTLWVLYILFWYMYMNKREIHQRIPFLGPFGEKFNLIPLVFISGLSFLYFTLETDDVAKWRSFMYEWWSIFLLLFAPRFIAWIFRQQSADRSRGKTIQMAREFCLKLHQGFIHYYMFWFLCIVAISIIPVANFFQYAQNKEIALEVKNRQLDLALKTEKRLSEFEWLTKVSGKRQLDPARKDSLLFHYGIYLDSRQDSISTYDRPLKAVFTMPTELYDTAIKHIGWNYRALDILLPFQNRSNDDHWVRDDPSGKCREMTLAYNLEPALKQPESISKVKSLKIISKRPDIFTYFDIGRRGIFFLVMLTLFFLWSYYVIIKKVLKRLFTITYFQTKSPGYTHGSNRFAYRVSWSDWHDLKLIDKKATGYIAKEKIEKVLDKYGLPAGDKAVGSLQRLWHAEYDYDRADKYRLDELENTILYNQYHLSYFYEQLWEACNEKEKYFLYDMAKDGFTNYKKTELIQLLLYKGLLTYEQDNLRIMSVSFRNFIAVKKGSGEITKLKDKYHVKGTWGNVRTPVLVAITAIGIFIFITQDGVFQRVGALIPTLSSLLGLGSTLLGSKTSGGGK